MRSWIWFAASVKFLIPFAALGAIGRSLGWGSGAPAVPEDMMRVLDGMGRPFSRPDLQSVVDASSLTASRDASAAAAWVLAAVWLGGVAVVLGIWAVRWRRAAALVQEGRVVRLGRELDILRRLEAGCDLQKPVGLVSTPSMSEPGVFGILNPVILWPHTIGERLDDEHVQAILAHELSHVRRRDNLAAAVHTIVQSLFWFHPVVWFVGARLVQEREQACDDAAIQLGTEPQVYAESILKTCQFSLGLPSVLVSSASGSNLKRRIEAIMSNRRGRSMNVWKQLLLGTAVAGALVGPIAAGATKAQTPPPEAPARVERPAVASDADLAFAEVQPPAPLGRMDGRRYHHVRTGITFGVPDDWMLGGTYPSSDNGEQAVLVRRSHPQALFYVWMVQEPVAPANIELWLNGAPQQKLEQRHGNYRIPDTEGYRLREGSVYRRMFGGHQGIVAIADYTHTPNKVAMSEYMTWIYTETGRTFFFARVAADDLVLLQGQFEGIINSAVIP